MSELLLELFSEEIPARMQARASDDLKRLVTAALKEAGVESANARAFATPRRLTLVIDGLPDKTPDVKEERKGPKIGAPDQAIQGFLRAAGLASIDQASVQEDKKGAFYVALTEKKGRQMADLIAEIVPQVVRNFPWPKSMRSGRHELRWVRPLHSILCILGGKLVSFDVDGIKSGDTTQGHRFMAPAAFAVTDFANYEKKLEAAKVILDPVKRAEIIKAGALKLAAEAKLTLVEDEALLNEVAGLVEWPVPLIGSIDEQFMEVPQEVLTSTMRANQKYFACVDSAGKLAPRFIVVANLIAGDGGKAIVNGNERVLRARFSDARFLWEQDKKLTLESRLPKLEEVVFQAKLGTVREKAERIAKLARQLSAFVPGADADKAEIAGRLAKADLTSGMVGEFPELQGLMGGYYAKADGLGEDIGNAIAEHYAPAGPSDAAPASALGKIVSLADKLDTLAGFFGIGERPTGSKDPFALRRAALGVIRIILESDMRLDAYDAYDLAWKENADNYWRRNLPKEEYERILKNWGDWDSAYLADEEGNVAFHKLATVADAHFAWNFTDIYEFDDFFSDRFSNYLRDKGLRHDLVNAARGYRGLDLVLIVKRVEALSAFLATDDGANLLAGYKRAVNILKIEEKKDGKTFDGAPDAGLFAQDEEKALAAAIATAAKDAQTAVAAEDFAAAMGALAKLRAPVDAFFEKVTVNADDKPVRENRLKLLAQIRVALHTVADFSKVEG